MGYNPNQPRAKDGEWTGGSGGGLRKATVTNSMLMKMYRKDRAVGGESSFKEFKRAALTDGLRSPAGVIPIRMKTSHVASRASSRTVSIRRGK